MLTHNRIHVSYSKEIKCVSFCKAPRCPTIELLIRLHTGLFCLQSSVHLIILLKKRASLSQAATKWYKKCAIKQHLQEKKKLGNFHGNLGQLTELQLGHICCSPRDSAFSKNLDNNNLKFCLITVAKLLTPESFWRGRQILKTKMILKSITTNIYTAQLQTDIVNTVYSLNEGPLAGLECRVYCIFFFFPPRYSPVPLLVFIASHARLVCFSCHDVGNGNYLSFSSPISSLLSLPAPHRYNLLCKPRVSLLAAAAAHSFCSKC